MHLINKTYDVTSNYGVFNRWGFTPLSEADRFGHTKVAEYIRTWILREEQDSGGTLTAKGGEQLLQQLQEMAVK